MAFDKITAEDQSGKGVVGLPDTPQLDTAAMQKKFDELATDVIIPHFNALVEALSGDSAAESTGAKPPSGLTSDENVQAIFDKLYEEICNKQPKEDGKGLSSNDYSDAEKRKVGECVEAKHTHDNKTVLDAVTNSVKEGYDRIVKLLDEIKSISDIVADDETMLPTGKAIVAYMKKLGSGDMQSATYDPDGDGKVTSAERADSAGDSDALGGVSAGSYLKVISFDPDTGELVTSCGTDLNGNEVKY